MAASDNGAPLLTSAPCCLWRGLSVPLPANSSAPTSTGDRAEPGEGLRAAPARRCRFHGARRAHAAPRLARGETAPGCGRGGPALSCHGAAVPSAPHAAAAKCSFPPRSSQLVLFSLRPDPLVQPSCRAAGLCASGLMQERHFAMFTAAAPALMPACS